ncbi:1-acyl-sn-glycerol-3-phosphate acyltransferase [Spirochaeta africana]|uniref:1-acyl-sn-glycerol-3-phosphate acyltransferase n=1 Tax=Spirochaeta africana (strain ATCC 700263 / DSM 8902 / Z-7692) TaxID=889378 RepID=H9UGY0_SPIAZ|nr:1-acyl-sn-glycerol-3-phosphate acyltransferase [Spirochaeta africana]AFG36773.1 1-acyl-sn-glycerol-3-phosphate acyltransferase [Spirochaeta africana DSM 8902]
MKDSTRVVEAQKELIEQLLKNASSGESITPDTVYQIGNEVNRKLVGGLIEKIMLPGSEIMGYEHLEELHNRSKAGESCLLLVEHYSNFDIPAIFRLLERRGETGTAIADSIIAIAGMKLTVENPVVRAFTEAYTRIVIYPSRSLKQYEGTPNWDEEKQLSNNINRAALHAMIRAKHNGHIILVFPSGTRYREGEPATKRGLPEMDSYLKSFDHVAFLGIAGNLLKVTDTMHHDEVTPDVMILNASPVQSAKGFRTAARENATAEDLKQATADAVMQQLDDLHQQAQAVRRERLASLG